MRTTPFSEIVARRRPSPQLQADLEIMRRASLYAVQITQSLSDAGLTEQQLITTRREIEDKISGEAEVYHATCHDYINAMCRDLTESAVLEEPANYMDGSIES